ncbi:SGNH/GDSL hydrolase family protein [Microbacterium sp. ET2]|uniref:SGNH/GDSL hydrolase family protein n=1 Tax=Microbacterium albipurpureum TaxID=3050384 RepID=UPI00259CA368|nr:SGNH/GDSL hydrolase family protein [Microbacterium sp. ET2 (Ac-2212)]WJL94649.1 SGNH/GDSL hydrolase family protein [Microbacterium sp. ET2 (Ac-2212)]
MAHGQRPSAVSIGARRRAELAVAGAVLALVALVFVVPTSEDAAGGEAVATDAPRSIEPDGSGEPHQSAAHALGPFSTPSPTRRPDLSPSAEPEPPRRAAFMGDSYTQGGGAELHAHRWSTLAADDLGWVEVNLGLGGTGFVTTNSWRGCGRQYCPTYVEMVAEVVAASPDVVVVAGGQNDFGTFVRDPERVRAAVWQTFTSLGAALPDADIVAVGPSTPWEVDDVARGLDAVVQEAAEAVGASYISMLEPNVIDPAFSLGDGHVGNDGHRAIADRVVEHLRSPQPAGIPRVPV